MTVSKKKKEKRRKIKAYDKLMKGREVYSPVIYLRLVDVAPIQVPTVKKTNQ